MLRLTIIAAIVAALAVGCRSIEHSIDEPDPFDGGSDTDVDTDTDSDTDIDTDADTDVDTGPVVPCTSLDILFVVQEEISHLDEMHEHLSSAMPGFVDALWESLPSGISVHAGLTTGDFSNQPSCSSAYTNCAPAPDAGTEEMIPDHYTTPDVLETTENGGQGRLFVYDDIAYFEAETPSGVDSAALSSWLVGAVDELSSDGCSYAMYSAAVGWAAHPANTETNAGFLRDAGAVLLIVSVGNLPDVSPDPLEDYKAMLAAEKATCGVDQCTLSAALIWGACIMYSTPYSPDGFLELFGETPILGDVNEPADYPLVLGGDLAQQVAETCDEIGPG